MHVMKHLSKDDLEELRRALEHEQKNLEQELAEHGRKVGGNWQGTAKGFDENEPDENDEADKMEELATNIPLVETLEARLKDVTDALTKMNDGTYGICEKTGDEIPVKRLRANPAARTTI